MNVFARLGHRLQALRWCHRTIAHLVGGVDDVDRVGVGHQFDLFERDNAVLVDRIESLICPLHAQ